MSGAGGVEGYPVIALLGESELRADTRYVSFTGDFGFWNRGPSAARLAEHIAVEAPLLARCDYRVLNLEFPLPGSRGRPADAECEARALQAIEGLGFDCVSLANNHALAFGAAGLDANVAALTARGLAVIGLRDRPAHAIELDGVRLALWSITDLLDEPDPDGRVLRCEADDLAQIAATARAADLHLGFPHLGSRSAYPSPRELKLARRLLALEPAALVCTGSHFPKGFTRELGAPVCFGLGNHLLTWEGGDTEPWGMHLLAGLRGGRLAQLLALPFRNTVLSGASGPLAGDDLAAFAAVLDERSTADPQRFFADPRTRAGVDERLRTLSWRRLVRLRPRHLLWGLRALWARRR